MPIWGCIADDITGATDLATNFVDRGLRTVVVFGVPDDTVRLVDADVAIVALKTRTAPVADAVRESLAALHWLIAQHTERFYVKYCSTFDSTPRGNIGPVIDAVLAELAVRTTIVVPSFPAAGRTVYQGHLFVGRQLLEESPMRDHPLTPMRDSDVARLLRPQTTGAVTGLTLPAVRRGSAELGRALTEIREAVGPDEHVSVVIDAVDDQDLVTIMEAARDLPLVTGGSGLALGVPAADGRSARDIPIEAGLGAVLCGSASARTQEQIASARKSLPTRRIDIGALRAGFGAEVDDVTTWAGRLWRDDPAAVPVVYSVGSPEDVERAAGPSDSSRAEPTSDLVERALAAIAETFVAAGVRRLVVAGGESSGRVMQRLGVTALRIGPEIAPGVAWSSATRTRGVPLTVALKSGNCGPVDMFTSCWEILSGRPENASKEHA